MAKISQVDSDKKLQVSLKDRGLYKVKNGYVIEVEPSKVPRIIGKKGSMVGMVKQATDCKVIVGQNGLIWVQGENSDMERLAIKTINMIENKSHIGGLTDKIKEFLEKETGKKIEITSGGEE